MSHRHIESASRPVQNVEQSAPPPVWKQPTTTLMSRETFIAELSSSMAALLSRRRRTSAGQSGGIDVTQVSPSAAIAGSAHGESTAAIAGAVAIRQVFSRDTMSPPGAILEATSSLLDAPTEEVIDPSTVRLFILSEVPNQTADEAYQQRIGDLETTADALAQDNKALAAERDELVAQVQADAQIKKGYEATVQGLNEENAIRSRAMSTQAARIAILEGSERLSQWLLANRRISRRKIVGAAATVGLMTAAPVLSWAAFHTGDGSSATTPETATATTNNVADGTDLSTPETETFSANLAPKDASYSLRFGPDVYLAQPDVDRITDMRDRFNEFSPATEITVEKIDELWKIDGTHLIFSDKLFPQSLHTQEAIDISNRQYVEIPLAIISSIAERAIAERDWKKVKAIATFVESFNRNFPSPNSRAAMGSNVAWRDGLTLFNPYNHVAPKDEEVTADYNNSLEEPFLYFACAVTSLYLDKESIAQQIKDMPTTEKVFTEPGLNISAMQTVDSLEKTLAKDNIRAVYELLKVFAVPTGESRGEGSISNAIDVALAYDPEDPERMYFGSFLVEVGLRKGIS